VRLAAAAYVAAKRSTCVGDIKGLVELYQPNAEKVWVAAWGWLVNLAWVLSQGRQAVFGT
jgi:hypothetical protein